MGLTIQVNPLKKNLGEENIKEAKRVKEEA